MDGGILLISSINGNKLFLPFKMWQLTGRLQSIGKIMNEQIFL